MAGRPDPESPATVPPGSASERSCGDETAAAAIPAAVPESASPAPARRRMLYGRIYLVLLLLALGVPKLVASAVEHGTSIDGGFYTDVARHIRDGDGFATCVSLYHQGFPRFPFPTTIYPLWPLLYGLAARLGGPLPEVGTHLATFFYFTTLALAYLWGRAFDDRDLFGAVAPGFHLGHLALLAVGVHREFFEFTSWPYTEGLAYTLAFGLLWRSVGRLARPGFLGGLECGLWAGLAFLARTQMLLLPAAFVAAVATSLAAPAGRRGKLACLAGFAAAFVACALPYYLHVRSLVVVDPLRAMLRFDAAHATPGLSFVPMLVPAKGPVDFLADRASGVVEAFDPLGRYAYVRAFGPLAWTLPLAILVAAADGARALWRRRAHPAPGDPAPVGRRVVVWLDRCGAARLFVVLLAAAAVLSLHAIHKRYYVPWNFARRQALVVVVAFLLAARYLARHRHVLVRLAALVLVAGTLTAGVRGAIRIADKRANKPEATGRPGYRKALLAWLDGRRALEGDLVVAMTAQEPQKIAWRTEGIGYHWIHKTTRPRDLAILTERLGVRYVLVHRDAAKWKLFRSDVFARLFVPEDGGRARYVSGFRVYRRRDPERDGPAPAAATARRERAP